MPIKASIYMTPTSKMKSDFEKKKKMHDRCQYNKLNITLKCWLRESTRS